MNVRLRWDAELFATIYYNGIRNNFYSIEISMLTNCNDSHEQNVAFERIRHFIQEHLDSSLLIHQDRTDEIGQFGRAGHKLVLLPEVPIDQIFAIALYCKLNAICEERLIITGVAVSSRMGEGMLYQIDSSDVGEKFIGDHWWNSPDCSTMPKDTATPRGKVVKINRESLWSDVGLDFTDGSADKDKNNNTVVFGHFDTREH